MAFCKTCNRKIEGKRSEHQCNLVTLDNERVVHASRIDNPQGDVRQQIEDGEAKIEFRHIRNPLKSVTEKFGHKGGPVILGGKKNQ